MKRTASDTATDTGIVAGSHVSNLHRKFKSTSKAMVAVMQKAIFIARIPWAWFTKYLMTILRLPYRNAKVTIDLWRKSY